MKSIFEATVIQLVSLHGSSWVFIRNDLILLSIQCQIFCVDFISLMKAHYLSIFHRHSIWYVCESETEFCLISQCQTEHKREPNGIHVTNVVSQIQFNFLCNRIFTIYLSFPALSISSQLMLLLTKLILPQVHSVQFRLFNNWWRNSLCPYAKLLHWTVAWMSKVIKTV